MKSLWIEDFNHSNIDDVEEEKWRVRYNLPKEDVILKKDLTSALKYIEDSYENRENFDGFDSVILDINLEVGEPIDGKDYRSFLKGVVSEEFLELPIEEVGRIGGFYIFLKLILDKDFPRERIVFLTSSYQIDTLNSAIDNLIRIFKRYGVRDKILDESKEEFEKYIRILKDIEEVKVDDVETNINIGREVTLSFLKNLRTEINSKRNLSDTYNRYEEIFEGAGIKPPKPYIKENEEYIEKFKSWLNESNTEYYILRRAIIEICRELISILKERKEKFILFKGFLHPKTPNDKKEMYDIRYFEEMLSFLQRALPIKEPKNLESYYKQIVRSISHDFEGVMMLYPYKFKIESYEENFLPVMKLLRNWSAHSRVEEKFEAKDVGILFIIAMRSYFDIGYEFGINMNTSIGRINYYEKNLLELYCSKNDEKVMTQDEIKVVLKKSFNYLTKREYKAYAGNEKWKWSDNATFNVYKKYEVIGGQNSNSKCHISDFYRLLWHSIFYSTWDDYKANSEDYTYIEVKFNTEEAYPYLNADNNIIGVLYKYTFNNSLKIIDEEM